MALALRFTAAPGQAGPELVAVGAAGIGLTVTVTPTVFPTQPATEPVTEYVVVAVGEAIATESDGSERPESGDQV